MMRSSRSSVFRLLPVLFPLSGLALLTGCTPEEPKAAPAPVFVEATPQQTGDLQAELQKTVPGARVGHVSAVNTQTASAAVLGIPLGDVHLGDSIQFRDAKQAAVSNGIVSGQNNENPEYTFLIVDYDFSTVAGGRAPKSGDMAVYLPRK
jgi:hypothetical protein